MKSSTDSSFGQLLSNSQMLDQAECICQGQNALAYLSVASETTHKSFSIFQTGLENNPAQIVALKCYYLFGWIQSSKVIKKGFHNLELNKVGYNNC